MKLICLALLLLGTAVTRGEDETFTWQDIAQSAQDWAQENLDPDLLRALQTSDQEKVQDFFNTLQKEFQGEYVIDLASVRDAARTILPLLQSRDETVPYAVWLKTRLDYFDVVDQIRLVIPAPGRAPGAPPPRANPTPSQERELWIKELKERPLPEPAAACVTNLKPIFASEHVPPELAWIAEVESSFDSRARSPSGAAGLFQLMPSTAKQYGLRLWPLDQRLNADENARAAAKHLRSLHQRFGDWRLALAAYNAGEGTVQRLLDRQKTRTFDSIASHLPAETQLYVPKVEATLLRREKVSLASLSPPAQ